MDSVRQDELRLLYVVQIDLYTSSFLYPVSRILYPLRCLSALSSSMLFHVSDSLNQLLNIFLIHSSFRRVQYISDYRLKYKAEYHCVTYAIISIHAIALNRSKVAVKSAPGDRRRCSRGPNTNRRGDVGAVPTAPADGDGCSVQDLIPTTVLCASLLLLFSLLLHTDRSLWLLLDRLELAFFQPSVTTWSLFIIPCNCFLRRLLSCFPEFS